MRSGYKFTNPVSERNIARILKALETPMTSAELAEAMAMDRKAVNSYLSFLMERGQRRVRIAAWRRNFPGHPSPVYGLGSNRDAHKPKPFTTSEKCKRWHAKPGTAEALNNKRKAQKIQPYRDPMTSAFFGDVTPN